jgi:peptidyl-prolyl isomerase D
MLRWFGTGIHRHFYSIMVRPHVFFEVKFTDKSGKACQGRIEMELYDDVVPKTSENFKTLCTTGVPSGPQAGKNYRNSLFHRVIPDFMIQGGDFTRGDGTGGVSIFGAKFADENFKLRHTKSFLLSMANAGPNTNGSQFFITTVPCPWLDGKHVVFGELANEDSKNLVREIEKVARNPQDRPLQPVTIVNCGAC